MKWIGVKYSLFISFERSVSDAIYTNKKKYDFNFDLTLFYHVLLHVCLFSTLSYNNFTFGYDNVQKPVLQSLEVNYMSYFQ